MDYNKNIRGQGKPNHLIKCKLTQLFSSMKLTPIAANQTELTLNNGTQVFFSYKTPVAAYCSESGRFLRTNYKWSVTTSRHINKWLDTRIAENVDQSVLDNLVK